MNHRFSRQIRLPEIGEEGQKQLKSARVLCIGAGGLGSPIAYYLTAAGVGTLGLIDPDVVDVSNLQRQILFKNSDQGKNKVDVAQQTLSALNPEINIITYTEMFQISNALQYLSDYDLVIDGSDNFETKFLVNDAAYKCNIPWVYGAISGFEGEVALFFGNRGACYRCYHPQPPRAIIQNCAQAGVLGSVAGITGSLQATLALQYLLSRNSPNHDLQPSLGQLTKIDLKGDWNFHHFKIHKNPSCPTCSLSPEKVQLTWDAAVTHCQNVPTLNLASLQESFPLIQSGQVLLIDVRELDEWKDGHIPEAHHWPLSLLKEGKFPTISNQVQKIILYCQAGKRSQIAAQIFIEAGIHGIYHLDGGYEAYLR